VLYVVSLFPPSQPSAHSESGARAHETSDDRADPAAEARRFEGTEPGADRCSENLGMVMNVLFSE
jgi:hypothetical protein